MRRTAQWTAALCVVMWWACWDAPRLYAQTQQVELWFAAPESDAEEVKSALSSALELDAIAKTVTRIERVDPQTPIRPRPESDPPLARIWVDFADGQVTIYVTDRAWERLYVRVLRRGAAQTAVDAAETGEIVRAAVEALRDGAVIGLVHPQLVRRAAEPIESGVSAALGAYYGAGIVAARRFVHGPGLFVRLSAKTAPWGLVALAQIAPRVVETTVLTTRLDTLALRLGPSFHFPWSEQQAFLLHAAFGADLVRVAPKAREGLQTSEPRVLRLAVAQLGLGVRHRTKHHAELWLGALLDVDMSNTRYAVRRGTTLQTIENPATFRPSLVAGVGAF